MAQPRKTPIDAKFSMALFRNLPVDAKILQKSLAEAEL